MPSSRPKVKKSASSGTAVSSASAQGQVDGPKRKSGEISDETRRKMELYAGILLPPILLAAAGYSVYAFDHYFLVGQLLHKNRYRTVAYVLIPIFYILFVLAWAPFFRLLLTFVFNPGFTSHRRDQSRSRFRTRAARTLPLDRDTLLSGEVAPPPGLEYYYSKDVFVCDKNGLPLYCDQCQNWKPDRTHHCRQMNRCVRRMDHFCPWIGGVVSETNMKFFIQFGFFVMIWCALNMCVMAWAIAKFGPDAHYVVLLVLAIFFGLMAFGMFVNWIQYAMKNITTIEVTQDTSQMVLHLAVHIPRGEPLPERVPVITYPLQAGNNLPLPAHGDIETSAPAGSSQHRSFAIISTQPGDNPWDLGTYENLQSILGKHWWDWILPLRLSPCCDHSSPVSDYPLGPTFKALKVAFGLRSRAEEEEMLRHLKGERRKKRKKRHSRREEVAGVLRPDVAHDTPDVP